MSNVDLRHGDCLAVMRELPDNSVDAVVTDPPYSLTDRRNENCASDMLRDAIVSDAAHDVAHLAEQFVPLRVTCGLVPLPVVGGVDLDAQVPVGDEEVDRDAPVVRQDDEPLVNVGDAVPGQESSGGDLRLWVRQGHARCVGACRCLGKGSDGRIRVPVRLRHNPPRQAKRTSGVVALAATEVAAVLALDLAGGTAELLPASGADTLDPAFEILSAEPIGALARAGGLPPVLESSRVGEVGIPAGGALTFDLLVHRSVLSWRPSVLKGFMSSLWDGTGIETDVRLWRECLRVLKPGGHLLSFGGTRTWHRVACAIEDAGFEVRDSIAYMHGQGFPKSLDVSKAIDKAAGATREVIGTHNDNGRKVPKHQNTHGAWEGLVDIPITAPATDAARQWQGWGTALKPAFEPVVVARKPLVGTVAQNVQQFGTGALNIDGCRIDARGEAYSPAVYSGQNKFLLGGFDTVEQLRKAAETDDVTPDGKNRSRAVLSKFEQWSRKPVEQPAGRWPANVALDSDQAAALDQMSGISKSPPTYQRNSVGFNNETAYGKFDDQRTVQNGFGDSGGASRYFLTAEPDAPDLPIDELAERFMYCAKAPKSERPNVNGISHPTTKPLTLMKWLVRLVTPPGGTILEPFAGSGTTVEAAILEGFDIIAIEREADYLPLIQARIFRAHAKVAAAAESVEPPKKAKGRWPANVALDEESAEALDLQSGKQKDGVAVNRNRDPDADKKAAIYGRYRNGTTEDATYGGGGGASRYFFVAKSEPTPTEPEVWRDGAQQPDLFDDDEGAA